MRWFVLVAVPLGVLALPSVAGAYDPYGSIYTTTGYTNTANGSQGSHTWRTSFSYQQRTIPLAAATERTWTPASGHTEAQLRGTNWVFDEQEVGYFGSLSDTSCPVVQDHTTDPTKHTAFLHNQCAGTTANYYVTTILIEELPAGSIWNLTPGTYAAMVPKGNVYRSISSDRRTMTITHVNTGSPNDPNAPAPQPFTPEAGDGGTGGSDPATSPQRCRFDISGVKADKNTAHPPTHGWYENRVSTSCTQVSGDPIVARCSATIETPEEEDPRNRYERDEQANALRCNVHAEIRSECMWRGIEDPCDNFRFRRHWWWTKLNKKKSWPAGSRCRLDPDANLDPTKLRSQLYRNPAGRHVLHCSYTRLGSGWGRNLG
jgi:hypothetical protein